MDLEQEGGEQGVDDRSASVRHTEELEGVMHGLGWGLKETCAPDFARHASRTCCGGAQRRCPGPRRSWGPGVLGRGLNRRPKGGRA